MQAERQKILRMLQQGQIDADEAMQLLNAIDTGEATDAADPFTVEADDVDTSANVLTGDVISPNQAHPDMDKFRRFWQIPFFIALACLIASALGLRALYQTADGRIGFWFVCVWSLFMLTVLLTTLAFLSRRSPWLHVRVQERNGRRIAISLPLPLRLASWGITMARGFADEESQDKLDMAASFLDVANENMHHPDNEPVMINIDGESGDQVQVYIG
ncbi:MAG: hypothetical protein H6660_16410 [Ardenticatenaceae bacterium]|nr:hypothetical protein [Ardenticatenaceae bacterium]